MIKTRFSRLLLGAFGLLFAVTAASVVRAGSAVAVDDNGQFGYAYGDRPLKELEREARHRCADKSKYPGDVRISVSTESRGAGIILRYRADGGVHFYSYVGADSAAEAYQYALDGVHDKGGQHVEVVARWKD